MVSLRAIAMRFGATRAVDGIDLDLNGAEVHGLIGENGAGKSTLMRVLAGFFDDYEGAISIDGRRVDIASPAHARREGIALVHQELSLLPEFTVAENIFLGREPRGRVPGSVSFPRMNREAQAALVGCGVDLPADRQGRQSEHRRAAARRNREGRGFRAARADSRRADVFADNPRGAAGQNQAAARPR